MSIWTAPFQDPIDEAALASAQAALETASGPEAKLLQLLTQTLRHTGAEAALLVQRSAQGWQLTARAGQPRAGESITLANPAAATSQGAVCPLRPLWFQRYHRGAALRALPALATLAPLAIIEYSAKIQDTIALQDASHRGGWTHEPCVQRLRLRSILCVPFTCDGLAPPPPKESLSMSAEAPRAIHGALYLADSAQPDLFRPGRIALAEQLLHHYLNDAPALTRSSASS